MTIRARRRPPDDLSLAQTGWRLSTWNADDVLVEPSSDVVLAVGRRDQMCREFAGYADPKKFSRDAVSELTGRRPEPSTMPYLLKDAAAARFKFRLESAKAGSRGHLRLHTADQTNKAGTSLAITVNGQSFTATLPQGLGIQDKDPAHLAFPATVFVCLPAGAVRVGENLLEVRVINGGWFTWDAIDLILN